MNSKKIIMPKARQVGMTQMQIDALSSEEEKKIVFEDQIQKLAYTYPPTMLLMAWRKALPDQYKPGESYEMDRILNEFRIAGYMDDNESIENMLAHDVLELVSLFSTQGHSGDSADNCAYLFRHLVNGNLLTPLTGEDSEWKQIEPGIFQNVRHASVFKDGKDGKAHCPAIIFRDRATQSTFIRGGAPADKDDLVSRMYFDFPFIPRRFMVDVDVIGTDNGQIDSIVNPDAAQLAAVREYYANKTVEE